MPFNGGGGGSGGSIATDMYFASLAARNAMPADRRVQGVVCAVEDGADYDYYQWDEAGNTWRAANLIFQGTEGAQGDKGDAGARVNSAAFNGNDIRFGSTDGVNVDLVNAKITLRGETGPSGPNIIVEYSINAGGPWVNQTTYDGNPTAYTFRRESRDGGLTFQDGHQFKASQASLPAGYTWAEDGQGGLQLADPSGDNIMNVTSQGVTTERLTVQDSVISFGGTKMLQDVGENVAFMNTITDIAYVPVWQETTGDWRAVKRVKGAANVKMNNPAGYVSADETAQVTADFSMTLTANRRISAFYTNAVSGHTNATILISQGARTMMRLEGFDIIAGEQRHAFLGSNDEHPFMDAHQGQTLRMQVFDSNGTPIQVRPMTGAVTTPWFAIDSDEFEDVDLVHAGSMGEGVAYDNSTEQVHLTAGTPTELGGFKVGVGLAVDSDGVLTSTVSGSVVTSVSTLDIRRSLPIIPQSYTCNVISEERIYITLTRV